jgi:hypothetical protein
MRKRPELEHGARVLVTATLCRAVERRKHHKTLLTQSWKVWQTIAMDEKPGVFLGWRTLRNGVREWEGDEVGYVFFQRETVAAALVSLSRTLAPVYVPLDALHVAPVGSITEVCAGCGAHRVMAARAVVLGRIACCPECSTMSVGERNALREAVAERLRVERLKGNGATVPAPDEGALYG